MATLDEILAEVGLGDAASSQTKTASAKTAPSSEEVNKVLENLGLSTVENIEGAGVTKVASQERNHMGLTDIYESLFGEEAATTQEKTAAATTTAAQPAAGATETAPEDVESSTALGEATGIYFNILEDAMTEKLAGDLEAEAGAGTKPQAHAPASGELTRIVGKEGDPAIAMNHDASSGAGLKVNPGNQTPYSLKEKAIQKAILKRRTGQITVGGFHE